MRTRAARVVCSFRLCMADPGYRQLIAGKVSSFDDYQRQIELITVKSSCIKLGAELGRGNYGRVYR